MLLGLDQGVAPKLTGSSELGKTHGGRITMIVYCVDINSQYAREGKH
jgi:hypothetical protein